MKMDRWSPDREDVRRYLRAHPIFRFFVAFCFGFTGWGVASLIFGSTVNSFRGGVLYGLVFAAFLTTLLFVFQRWGHKGDATSRDDDNISHLTKR